jgi:hypothetical protein
VPIGLQAINQSVDQHVQEVIGKEHLDLANEGCEQFLYLRVGFPQDLDSLDGVADSRVVPPVIESSDPGRAPPSHVLGKVHRDLTIENGWLRAAVDARLAQLRCDHLINRSQGNALTGLGRSSFMRKHDHPRRPPLRQRAPRSAAFRQR